MEASFGQDFADVRIHTDSTAARAASALHTQAFTAGRHIYFGEGRYQPHTREGRRLLAHELTHVVQQRAGGYLAVAGSTGTAGARHDRDEEEADRVAESASRPVDPGIGEGLDVTFILAMRPQDPPNLRPFAPNVTWYVKNVLKSAEVYEVNDLEDIIQQLWVIRENGDKVRRIRIVGHGNFGEESGGTVYMHDPDDPTTKGFWITPSQVREFAGTRSGERSSKAPWPPTPWSSSGGAISAAIRPPERPGPRSSSRASSHPRRSSRIFFFSSSFGMRRNGRRPAAPARSPRGSRRTTSIAICGSSTTIWSPAARWSPSTAATKPSSPTCEICSIAARAPSGSSARVPKKGPSSCPAPKNGVQKEKEECGNCSPRSRWTMS
ncbi:MAG: DUF4157 domain-containing protein [Rhodospirillales bacterium]|nr:DUF4157 domain-containing protein [Rhodospirillales bacterium]